MPTCTLTRLLIMCSLTAHTGRQKIDQLKRNANLFRAGLERMGCEVLGDQDSPVCGCVGVWVCMGYEVLGDQDSPVSMCVCGGGQDV